MTPNGRVANKVALVTGAASWIGKATAQLLAGEGATVVATDVAAEAGRRVVEEIGRGGGRAVFLPLDVTQEAAWQDATDRILQDFAGLDIQLATFLNLVPDIRSDTKAPAAIERLTAVGRMGVKSGGGFYDYPPERLNARRSRRDALLLKLWKLLYGEDSANSEA